VDNASWGSANLTCGDIFESCFKAQISKLERLFSLKRGKRDVRALSFELWNSIWKCHVKVILRDRLYPNQYKIFECLLTDTLINFFCFATFPPVSTARNSLNSWNFFSEFQVFRIFWSNVKLNPVISWNQHNSFQRIFPFEFWEFYYASTSGAFPSMFFFQKEPFKCYWEILVDQTLQWGIYESTPHEWSGEGLQHLQGATKRAFSAR